MACSAGGFGGFHLSIFRVFCRHFGFTADWENWGEHERLSEEVVGGGGEGKIIQDGGLNIYIHSPRQNPPALQAKEKTAVS